MEQCHYKKHCLNCFSSLNGAAGAIRASITCHEASVQQLGKHRQLRARQMYSYLGTKSLGSRQSPHNLTTMPFHSAPVIKARVERPTKISIKHKTLFV